MTNSTMTQSISYARKEINDADSATYNMRKLCEVMESAERQWLFNVYDSAKFVLNQYINQYGALDLSA